jgi:hypothetical protein
MASFALCIRHHNELRRNIRRRFPNGQRLTRQMYYPLVASVILASRRSASISQRLFCAFTKFICGLHAILCRRLDAPCRFFVIVSYGVSILLLAWFGITSAFRRQISLRTPTVCWHRSIPKFNFAKDVFCRRRLSSWTSWVLMSYVIPRITYR